MLSHILRSTPYSTHSNDTSKHLQSQSTTDASRAAASIHIVVRYNHVLFLRKSTSQKEIVKDLAR